MKKMFLLFMVIGIAFAFAQSTQMTTFAKDIDKKFYTIYDAQNSEQIVFMSGGDVQNGDQYISSDNKLYEITDVNTKSHTAKAQYKENVALPVVSVKKREAQSANAAETKKVGMYHTHNDECYVDEDGVDSVYGKGGIHDVGAKLKKSFEDLGMQVSYSEALHLPHNSGAYTRSSATAAELLRNNDLDAIFDIHRDATPKSEYETTVDGEKMSKVRMVVGNANVNSASNKDFALTIKSYADEVYPGLIKDIYIGKGNYNQQLSERAMLFEMGCHLMPKSQVLKSTVPLSKTIDVVLFGTDNASPVSMQDVEAVQATTTSTVIKNGLVNEPTTNGSLDTLWVVLGTLGYIIIMFFVMFFTNKTANYNIKRFFSELFGGFFGKKDPQRDI